MGDKEIVNCPFCGGQDVHIESVRINAGDRIIDVKRGSTKEEKPTSTPRGASIEVLLWCEIGRHKWTHELQFHKGQTFITDSHVFTADCYAFIAEDLWREPDLGNEGSDATLD
jgi:hypothetical protein